MPSRRPLCLVLALAAAVACSPAARDAAPPSATPITLAIAGRSNENVSVAARGQFVTVAWSAATDSATDIYAATSRDGGTTFSEPVRVNSVDGQARVNSEMPPRVALIPRGDAEPEIAVVWTDKVSDGWRVLHARSADGGVSFGSTAPVPGGDAGGSRGWQSVAVDSAGRLVVVWLDHRDFKEGNDAPVSPALPPGAPEMSASERSAGRSMLYVSTLGGADPHTVVRSVCYCCKTSMVAAGGNVYAVWRHVYPGNERDIAFTVSGDGGQTFAEPVRVSADRWKFDGCPDNGPAVAIDRMRRAHVLWVTPRDGGDPSQMELYHAVSTPDAKSFSPRAKVATTGLPGHAQVALEPDGTLLLAWDEIVAGERRVMLARATVDAAGATTIAPVTSPEGAIGDNPAVAATDRASVLAWVRSGGAGTKGEIAVALVR